MNQQTVAPSSANGHSSPHDIFVLSDEQILEIEPEPQDVAVREDVAQSDRPATASTGAYDNESRSANRLDSQSAASADQQAQTAQAGLPVPLEPPAWLAETMNDPQRGAEARALWEGAQRAEKEAASYREVFEKPEDARSAAERARVLDDIDRAYFAGDPAQRAQLAARMLREDPAAFREMVFAGLRALEAAEQPGKTRSIASAVGATPGSTSGDPGHSPAAQQHGSSAQQAQLDAYAAFEKAANDDLERSVGTSIERTLGQALPSLATAGHASGAETQHAAPLQARLTAAIRQDIDKALQGDRQLGEQVAQILSARRLDNETRAQVVRLIADRAQQLVPSATKRALNDWTQTTLATHRGKNTRADASAPRREVAPANPSTSQRDLQAPAAQRKDAPRAARTDSRDPSKGRVDYRKLSDEQILEL